MAIEKSAVLPQKTEVEHEFTDAQVEESGRLMEEVPRIEGALKNYLSNKMAEGLSDMAASRSATEDAEAEPVSTPATSSASLQGCARVILKTLNALQLPPAPEWSQRHPQKEEEQGMDFIARVGSYKVVQALWSKCLAAGQKPAKLLGKSSLKFALIEVSSQLLADLPASAAAAKASEEEFRIFLAGFEATLTEDASDPLSEAAIVWCADLRAALTERQQARKAVAEERVNRQKSAESFNNEMKAALSGYAPADVPSSVQIEEVGEVSQATKMEE
jgi:hypothetical protein